ncbi:MAG: pyridoxal phosphate-dependent aminotransferase family protein [Sulfurovum sp.]|nr:pyridoxal phosphate-dependent aminotransferase family protein [Sulfurovum sp.]MCB4749978.1 pyridoxal phosphate-dependent aminotransferase family protein [Sulfurovum sp.]MCB4775588.1 pyridoxal phosphate-dependent aminotransferase family protein [Sulfurovum sp.]
MYEKELEALKKAGRFRERILYSDMLDDFASNDYLGLSKRKKSFKRAVKMMKEYSTFSPRASQLVNGYHSIHYLLELEMAKMNGFEKGMIVGSGFLANLALIEALVRKGDILFLDEAYHASGQLAAQLHPGQVVTFKHNDAENLKEKLLKHTAKRRIIAVEGVYSMEGDLCVREIFEVAEEFEALLIVDEAHSSGILGENLLGIFEHYGIIPNEHHIKMGTLGKAYGSYGAYILASKTIISFLENRAKSVIYTTAPSVFDTALAYVNMQHIQKNVKKFHKKIFERQAIVKQESGAVCESLIFPIEVPDNAFALFMQKGLMKQNYLVGAIRQPTVTKPILRIILNITESTKKLHHLLKLIRINLVQ